MERFLVIICCAIVLSICIMSSFGFWNFVNSSAAEAQAWAIVDGISAGLVLLGKGLFAILIALALGGFLYLSGHGAKAGAEATGRGVAAYILAKRAAQLMPPNVSVETPDVRIFPPPTQVMTPDKYIIGGDYPIQQACLPSYREQTD